MIPIICYSLVIGFIFSILLISSALCILSTLFILINDFEDFSSSG